MRTASNPPGATKVLHLLNSFHKGGSESQAVQLLRLLRGTGAYELLVATLDGQGPLRAELEGLGLADVPEYKLSSLYDWNALAQLRQLAAYMKRQGVVILHTHDFYTNIFGMAAGVAAKVPVRIAERRESSSLRSGIRRVVERIAYRCATRVVANCEDVKRQLIEEGLPARKLTTIYNGLDLQRFICGSKADDVLAALGLPQTPGMRFVTLVANMRLPVKDHETFLRAAQRVAATVPPSAFVIAGEGELMPRTQAFAAELGLSDRTYFLGRCDRIADLLSLSAVGVLSSRSEGFSNAILEYMAAALPVVATAVGGAREAVVDQETGYLVEPGDDRAMAERIISLLQQPERARRMGFRGRAIVEQKFSCTAQLQSTLALYDGSLHFAGSH